MARLITLVVSLAVVLPARAEDPATPLVPPAPPAHHKSHNNTKKATPPPPLVLPPLPPGPLQQVPMDKIPATAPQVTYENGQLKIVAENSTLGSILKDVRRLTGASIDLPANGAPERVVTNIGPGAPRDVLAVLLNGTQFNYVMLGSNSDPASVSTVVLSPKPGGAVQAGTQTVANAAYQPPPQSANSLARPQDAQRDQAAEAQAEDPAEDASDDKTDDADQNQQVQPAPEAAQPDGANPNAADQANQPNGGPKTPEQMLEMMRQRVPGMGQQPGQPGPLNPPNNPSPPDQ